MYFPFTALLWVLIIMIDAFLLNDRETEVSLVSVVLLALLAQLDPVDLLAPLATMDPRYVRSSPSKE